MRSMKNTRSLVVTGGTLLLLLSCIGCHTQRHEPWNARPSQIGCSWPPPCTSSCLDPECYGYEQTCWRPWPGLCSECPSQYAEAKPDAENSDVENSGAENPDAELALPEAPGGFSAEGASEDGTSEDGASETVPEEISLPESEPPADEEIDTDLQLDDAFPVESPSDDNSSSMPSGAEDNDAGDNMAQSEGYQEMQPVSFHTPDVLEQTVRESQFFASLFPTTDRPLYLSGVWRKDCTPDAKAVAQLLMSSWDPAEDVVGLAEIEPAQVESAESISASSSESPVCLLEHPRVFTEVRQPAKGQRRAIVPTAAWLPMDNDPQSKR